MNIYKLIATLGFACATASCSNMQALWEDRYGPSPVFVAADVERATNQQAEVLRAFATGAGLPWPPPAPGNGYWYQLTLAGFNVVDDACTRYMEDLFGWERKRNRTKDILSLAAASTAAILGATNAGKHSLIIVAEAFGFATGATTIFADSYLFKLHPSTIQSIALKLQEAYRNATAEKAPTINSPAVAYQHVRGYLTLCLPVTLEQKIDEYLAATSAAQNPGAGNTKVVTTNAGNTVVTTTTSTNAATPNVSLTPK
jgi:hypothetical protein